MLLLASLTFYLAGGVKSIVWLVLIILITWTAGLLLGRQNAKTPADKAEKAAIQRRKKIISTFCAISCFGLLFAMKYWNFTLELLPTALGQHIPRWDFLVPLRSIRTGSSARAFFLSGPCPALAPQALGRILPYS